MELIGALGATIFGGACIYANLPTEMTIGNVTPTFSHLSNAELVPIRGGPKEKEQLDYREKITAKQLFEKGPVLIMAVRRPGCPFCRREATEIQKLLPFLKEHGVKLMAVTHETFGVNQFKEAFSEGEIYLDTKRTFYGPKERWLPVWMGLLRIGTYLNLFKSMKARAGGNLKGEGRLLGAVFFVANENVIYSHLEKEWGDAASNDDIRRAILKF